MNFKDYIYVGRYEPKGTIYRVCSGGHVEYYSYDYHRWSFSTDIDCSFRLEDCLLWARYLRIKYER